MAYALKDVLHLGRETRVVSAQHIATGASVALKMPIAETPAPRLLERLKREHALLRELEIPGVIRVLGIEPCAQGFMLVLELWGESLERALQRGPLPVENALRLAAATARVLGEVHRRGVLHRDVKPQNLLVNAELTDIRVIDFGIASRRSQQVESTTAAEQLAGTLAYMAPEQTGRTDRVIDSRADLYALGATLYQILTGELPFVTANIAELVHLHITRTPLPPHERAPERRIPEAVSAIVARLMAKSPDQRYQTADGAAHDLSRAAEAWAHTGTVAPFALGERDWEDRVRKPSRLFGREPELAVLNEALESACRGDSASVLVAGPSGVGKSALVYALRERARARRGLFAPGKFDLLQRGTPYAALAQALRSVVRRRLADPAEELARWREAWQRAAGPNGRILVDLIPELVHVLGEPPPLAEVGPFEARIRFQDTVQQFVRATATADHPLVLFLDDLQWADPASLVLLEVLLSHRHMKHILVVGAYRDNEVDEAHPSSALRKALDDRGVHVRLLPIAPLGAEALEQMVPDMLSCPAEEVRALSALVKARTDGSPFFVEQFLRALHERKLLARDSKTGRWLWQADAIERAGVTDNVVELLTAKLVQLPPLARRILSLSACAGATFESALLSEAAGLAGEALDAAVAALVREGLIVPLGETASDGYEFVHDRVQQAAYEALPLEARPRAHLALARAMGRQHGELAGDGELFAALYHYLRALPVLEGAEERVRVAALCLRGGQRAKIGSAYAEATSFLRAGRALLDEEGWQAQPGLTLDLHLVLGEAEWLAGHPEVGEPLLERCMTRAGERVMRARVALVWAQLVHMTGRSLEAIGILLNSLSSFGLSFPSQPDEQLAFAMARMARAAQRIQATSLEAWRALPRCSDPVAISVIEMLCSTSHIAAHGQPTLVYCTTFAAFEHTLEHGIASGSAYAVGMMASVLVLFQQDLALVKRCVDYILALRHEVSPTRSNALLTAGAQAQYVGPLSYAYDLLREGLDAAEREGRTPWMAYTRLMPFTAQLFAEHLDGIAIPTNLHTPRARELAAPYLQAHSWLTGRAIADPRDIERAALAASSSNTTRAAAASVCAFAALHLGFDEVAWRCAAAVEPVWRASWCAPPEIMRTQVFTVLGVAQRPTDPAEADTVRRKVAFHRGRLEQFAAFTPSTFRHIKLLVDATEARTEGRHDEAHRLYEQGIQDARDNGFVNAEALGLRLCGELLLARGLLRGARAYLREAREAYIRWGAHGAAEGVSHKHPDLFAAEPLVDRHHDRSAPTDMGTISSTTTMVDALNSRIDATAVLCAAQALAGDMVLGSLVGRMLRLLAENAGATRAVLALVRQGELRVAAQLTLDPEVLEVSLDEPVLGSSRLPATLVQYMARSSEPVVLGQAISDARFDDDPYLREHRPASVLAVPLVHQGRLSGAMYLEQPEVPNAFPEARVQLVTLLAAQAATAVENATLYAEVQRHNERLEQQVEQRTAELRAAKEAADAASQAKSDFLASMSHELRTPLNSILGYAQILERSPGLQSKERDGVRTIRSSGDHLLTLINDVLDLAKIEAGKMDLYPKDFRLASLVRTAANLCRVRADEKRLSFAYDVQGPSLLDVRADEKRLLQVLLNLLGNAIKFTERGRVRLTVDIAERADAAGDAPLRAVRFRIEDTGPGIAPEHVARIFEPFEQVGDVRARAEGTGLGLSICKRFVEQMGGQIGVESELGKGTVFTVTLRLPEAAGGTGAKTSSWDRLTGYEGERCTLMVVDDHEGNRAVLRDLLSPIGFEVLEAESGARALELAGARRPTLVLVDLNMPGMDGYETTRQLRREPGLDRLVILASSAGISRAAIERAKAAGCDGFVPKPVQADVLIAQIERHLGITWVYAPERDGVAPPAAAADQEAAVIVPPPDARVRLLDLAKRGRVHRLLEELDSVEKQDAQLAAWVGQVRALVRNFQLREAKELLRA